MLRHMAMAELGAAKCELRGPIFRTHTLHLIEPTSAPAQHTGKRGGGARAADKACAPCTCLRVSLVTIGRARLFEGSDLNLPKPKLVKLSNLEKIFFLFFSSHFRGSARQRIAKEWRTCWCGMSSSPFSWSRSLPTAHVFLASSPIPSTAGRLCVALAREID